MNIRPKTRPKWYEPRKVLCRWLVNLARWIEPRSEDVHAFMMQQVMNAAIYGQSFTRVEPEDFYKDVPKEYPDDFVDALAFEQAKKEYGL